MCRHCMNLHNNKLWKCPPIAYLNLIADRFSLSGKECWKPYLSYEGIGLDATNIALNIWPSIANGGLPMLTVPRISGPTVLPSSVSIFTVKLTPPKFPRLAPWPGIASGSEFGAAVMSEGVEPISPSPYLRIGARSLRAIYRAYAQYPNNMLKSCQPGK